VTFVIKSLRKKVIMQVQVCLAGSNTVRNAGWIKRLGLKFTRNKKTVNLASKDEVF